MFKNSKSTLSYLGANMVYVPLCNQRSFKTGIKMSQHDKMTLF